jgi:tripartite-type tricarboxylate transporter receptor subunit TctC
MQEVARAEDQHTIILGHISTLAVNPFMFDKLPYDAVKDFKPISLLASGTASSRLRRCLRLLPTSWLLLRPPQ